MVVRKTQPLPIECVVRGYVSGSGWKDYKATGKICGIALPAGLRESDRLPEPIFTPATKAATGHDENISFEQAASLIGTDLAERVRASASISTAAPPPTPNPAASSSPTPSSSSAFSTAPLAPPTPSTLLCGSTKLSLLTPRASGPPPQYKPGGPQPSFDKQFVRDYLERIRWPKTPPGPELPPDVVAATRAKYREAYRILAGHELELIAS